MFFKKKMKGHWKKLYKGDLERGDLDYILAKDLWENWETSTAPESMAELHFGTAETILSAEGSLDLAQKFLFRVIKIVDRMFEENKFESPGCINTFPNNRAIASRLKAFSESILGGELDKSALLSASKDFEDYCYRYKWREMDDFTSYDWVDSIQTALIGGDSERANILLNKVPKTFNYNKLHFEILTDFLSLSESSDNNNFDKKFKSLFDIVRDPKTEMLKGHHRQPTFSDLQLSILYEKFVANPGADIDWGKVIGRVAE